MRCGVYVQLGYNDLSIYGSPTIRTRNIDRLATEGTRFTQVMLCAAFLESWGHDGLMCRVCPVVQMQFYAPAPICTPSRGAFLTGKYPIRCCCVLHFFNRGLLWCACDRSGLYTNLSWPIDMAFRVFYPSSVGKQLLLISSSHQQHLVAGCLPSTELTLPKVLKSAGECTSTSLFDMLS